MLRVVVICLFVFNLLLLGLQTARPVARQEAAPGAAPETPTRIPTIHLFSEMQQDQGLMLDNRQCFTLGPFHTRAELQSYRERLHHATSRTRDRYSQAQIELGYRVVLPPYASLLEANRALLSLQALGLEDIGIIFDGELANGISLGYFLRQENAQRRLQALRDRGYEPRLQVRRQTERRYWLDYEQMPGSGFVSTAMDDRPDDLMLRPLPCPEQQWQQARAEAGAVTAQAPPDETAETSPGDPVEDDTAEPGDG